ncbi:MAG: DUF364 domain-containing protein [Dehalococcoidales bacterium]|jgi:uncharacterized protein (DUF4213/DUF364 family)|nr:DUF364 domain-containing protein [Dehalococcoidales bacterium]MDD5122696.1 DUF364 domain-containing protein [Dehalococcoidales bacterium]MDD5499235.1 DUF364 domain-containing protein [Dehalococcoidales bacterium]
MANTIQQRIIESLAPACDGLEIKDVRIGLGYSSVRLSNDNVGVAWTAEEKSANCTHITEAGSIAGRPASNVLEMLNGSNGALGRTLGLATANALVAGLPQPQKTEEDFIDLINIGPEDEVVMVGFFGPVIPKLKKTGCVLNILELNPSKPNTIPSSEGKGFLASCSVAIITSTSIITNTFDELITQLGNPRAVIMLGPSSIMYPEVFTGTPVTHVGGSKVLNGEAIERIVSEGGGTMIMKKHLRFETIVL